LLSLISKPHVNISRLTDPYNLAILIFRRELGFKITSVIVITRYIIFTTVTIKYA